MNEINSNYEDYHQCNDGGTWTIGLADADEGSDLQDGYAYLNPSDPKDTELALKLSVSVTGIEINDHFPSQALASEPTYFDKDQYANYWDIPEAIFRQGNFICSSRMKEKPRTVRYT